MEWPGIVSRKLVAGVARHHVCSKSSGDTTLSPDKSKSIYCSSS
jgi:hypothetical protein